MESASQSTISNVHIVPQQKAKSRLSDYLIGVFPSLVTKSSIKKALKKGIIMLNSKTGQTSDFISGGERIELFEQTHTKPILELSLEVLLEDDYLAVINKPAGLVVSGNKHRTIANALTYNLATSSQTDALPQPVPVHRLDYPTSGVLLVGKTKKAVVLLNKLFEERAVKKVYNAITIGEIDKTGIIDILVDNKRANTHYKLINSITSQRFKCLNLMELTPSTGRKHQLRIHMAALGNPILGDKQYGIENLILEGKGLFLHARSLSFVHPFSNALIEISSELPSKFVKIFS